MTDPITDPHEDIRAALQAATRRYEKIERSLEKVREELKELVITALKTGIGPAETARLTPWTAAHTRIIARDAGIPAFPPGGAGSNKGHRPASGRPSQHH